MNIKPISNAHAALTALTIGQGVAFIRNDPVAHFQHHKPLRRASLLQGWPCQDHAWTLWTASTWHPLALLLAWVCWGSGLSFAWLDLSGKDHGILSQHFHDHLCCAVQVKGLAGHLILLARPQGRQFLQEMSSSPKRHYPRRIIS